MPAQRVAQRAEFAFPNEWQRLEEIQSAHIIPNCFHRAALVPERFQIRLILRHQRVRWREHDVSSLGQFCAIGAVMTAKLFCEHAMPKLHIRGMEGEYGGD